MGKMVIHNSLLGHIKIDGEQIDDKVKELEIEAGTYDIVAGTDVDSAYNTEAYNQGSKSHIVWGLHNKIKVDDTSVCHVYIRRKFSFIHIIPIVKVKYKQYFVKNKKTKLFKTNNFVFFIIFNFL